MFQTVVHTVVVRILPKDQINMNVTLELLSFIKCIITIRFLTGIKYKKGALTKNNHQSQSLSTADRSRILFA
jgi:hypothetical protein